MNNREAWYSLNSLSVTKTSNKQIQICNTTSGMLNAIFQKQSKGIENAGAVLMLVRNGGKLNETKE